MKQTQILGALAVLTAAVAVAGPAAAQRKPSIAIMPSQYFTAEPVSAQNLTTGLTQQFEGQGYTVTPADRSSSTFQSMGLSLTTHYPDREALRFGRQVGADLVAYPRLLVVGTPPAGPAGGDQPLGPPTAVLLLRVINTHTGAAIYARQSGHEFRADAPEGDAKFELPQPVASAAAAQVLEVYFRTIAGSARETRGAR